MPLYPGLDAEMEAQVTAVLAGRRVDRRKYNERPFYPFHRKPLGNTTTAATQVVFFSSSSTKTTNICTLPNGKVGTNQPAIVQAIGFAFEGLTVVESAGTTVPITTWWGDPAATNANKNIQMTGLINAMQCSWVSVQQNNLIVAEGRLEDFSPGQGPTIQAVDSQVTPAANAYNQAINIGSAFPAGRNPLPDPLVLLPDAPISVTVTFGGTFPLAYETALRCQLYGSQITPGGIGVN